MRITFGPRALSGSAMGFSITIVSIAVYSYFTLGMSINQLVKALREFIGGFGVWGPILYVITYSFRSLIFFPASLLTAISGLIFGPLYGMLFTVIGENISGNISFMVGRYFGAGLLKILFSKSQAVPKLRCRFQQNGLLAVLTMRLMYLPFDLVGYMSGVCNIRHKDFALGTFVGTIPGLATFVFLGTAIADARMLYLAIPFFVFGMIFSRHLKKKEQMRNLISA
jgi:uncharacterized membrane protein YdjX (TVP38/TMEM64 family)